MKYTLYIDYTANYKPMTVDYRSMNAKNLADAILEADAIFDPQKHYMLQIMVKDGKVEKAEGGYKVQRYTAILEKRSIRWTANERPHDVKHYIFKTSDWYEIA